MLALALLGVRAAVRVVASPARSVQVLVHQPVAVVVQPVAPVVHRALVPRTYYLPGRVALPAARLTLAHLRVCSGRSAAITQRRQQVQQVRVARIRQTVAVVVQPVAHLRLWPGRHSARPVRVRVVTTPYRLHPAAYVSAPVPRLRTLSLGHLTHQPHLRYVSVLVRHTVAVVVQPVAQLLAQRAYRIDTTSPPLYSGRRSLARLRADLALSLARVRTAVGVVASPARTAQVLVHQPVTVVVQPVAHLRVRSWIAARRVVAHHLPALTHRLARAYPYSARHPDPRVRRRAHAVVGQPVAVVVKSVAALHTGPNLPQARLAAVPDTGLALPFVRVAAAVGIVAPSALFEQKLVRQPVAVVVRTIARLYVVPGLVAALLQPVNTTPIPLFTLALVRPVTRCVQPRLRQVVAVAVLTCLLVRQPVAVVVAIVAHLVDRSISALATSYRPIPTYHSSPFPALTRLNTVIADPILSVQRRVVGVSCPPAISARFAPALAEHSLVGQPVAVVVGIVARLHTNRRRHLTHALERRAQTLQRAGPTDPPALHVAVRIAVLAFVPGRVTVASALWVAFVGQPVAIVVRVVAQLVGLREFARVLATVGRVAVVVVKVVLALCHGAFATRALGKRVRVAAHHAATPAVQRVRVEPDRLVNFTIAIVVNPYVASVAKVHAVARILHLRGRLAEVLTTVCRIRIEVLEIRRAVG